MANVYEMQLKVGAQFASNFDSTFNSAQKKLTETQKAIQDLGKVQGNISAYQKQEAAMAKCLKQQDLYKTQITNLKKELQALTKENGQHGAGTASLANKILDLEKKMSSAAAEEDRHREALRSLGNELKAAGVDTKNLGNEIDKIKGKIGELKDEQEELAKQGEKTGEKGKNAIEEIGEALAAAGIVKMLNEGYDLMTQLATGAASYADEIGTVSIQYGIATEDLQAFSYAAELVDVSQETLTSTMSRNIRAMNSAREGTESYVEAYEKLGIKVTDSDGQLRDSETVYWEVIDALGAMENETERDAVAIELLGRSAQQVNTLVAAGSGVIKQYAAEAKRAGYVMSDEMLAASMALDDEIQRQNSNMMALKNTIGGHLAPEYTKLKQLENEVLIALTAFIDKNPEFVKGATAAASAIGLVVGGLAAYTAAANLASTATKAIPGIGPILAVTSAVAALIGVCVAATESVEEQDDEYAELTATSRKQALELEALKAEHDALTKAEGENSYEAWVLEEQIESLTAEYEASKKTIEEHRAELEAAAKDILAVSEEHNKAVKAIDDEYESSIALIEKLDQLSSSSENVAAKQALIQPIIDELNSRYEGLGLTIDYISGKLNLPPEKLREIAQATHELAVQEKDWETYVENIKVLGDSEEEYNEAKAELDALKDEYITAKNAIEDFDKKYYGAASKIGNGKELTELIKKRSLLNEAVRDTKKAYDDASKEKNEEGKGIISVYEKALEAIEEFENKYGQVASSASANTESTISYIEELGKKYVEVYKEAYDAAYESITGQFALWDNAAEVVPKSIEDINNALASQNVYWSDYNKDMSALIARGKDIEGLAEVIASFADGSEDSVNAIAGIASASDEELRLMVENYNLIKAQQEEAAKTLARSTSDELLEIEDQMNSTIENLDMKEEAALAGKSTIEAYVEALREGSEEAASILNSLANILPGYTAGGSNHDTSQRSMSMYATGTRNAREGWALVGENGPELTYMGGGEAVYSTLETLQLLRGIDDTYSLLESIPASGQTGGGNRYEISISPTFYVTSEDNSAEKLEEYSNIVANMVLDKLSSIDADIKRGAFA